MGLVRISSQLFIPTAKEGLGNNNGRPQVRYLENNEFTNLALEKFSGSSIEFLVDTSNYKLTLNLKNASGTTISSGIVDLPLESVVVNATYANGILTLALQNGNSIDVDISDIVRGLISDVKLNGTSLASDGVVNIVADTTPTSGSSNLITSAAVHSALAGYLALSGGTMTGSLVLSGEGKLILNRALAGKITDENGKILLGFSENNALDFKVGNDSYSLNLRGFASRPQYKGYDLALYGDIPLVNNGILTITENGISKGTFSANESENKTIDISVSNPNLLINSNFAINQRREPSYTANQYTVDRWYIGANATLTVSTNNVSITTTGASSFLQRMELPFGKLASRTVTISAKINSVVYSASGTVNSTQPSGTGETAYIDKRINENSINGYLKFVWNGSKSLFQCCFYFSNAQTVTFDWMKLEIGDTATGYTPPLIAEELPKCQRYYQILWAFKNSRSAYNFYEPYSLFKTEMRTQPTIIGVYAVSGTGVVSQNNNTYYDIPAGTEVNATVNPYGYASKFGIVLSNGSGTFTANHDYYCQVTLDAEIY